jgi:hypothetical protein
VIKVDEQFGLRHMVPIYRKNGDELPKLEGSSIYVRIKSLHFLLTAAHVTDAQKNGPLFIPGKSSGLLLPKRRTASGKTSTARSNDRFDIGWFILDDTQALELNTRFSPLSLAQIDFDDVTHRLDSYLFRGYYDAEYDPSANGGSFHHKLQGYYGPVLQEADVFKKLGIAPVSHIVIRWAKNNSFTLAGQESKPPDPHGMSGGGVWKFSSNNQKVLSEQSKLCGISIEIRKADKGRIRVLVATRINFWFEHIVAAYPQFRPLIPKPRRMQIAILSPPS